MVLSFRSLKIVIRCADLIASRAFYTEVLGLQVAAQWDEPEGRGLIVAPGASAPGALIEMYEISAADGRFDPCFHEPFCSDKSDLQLETPSVHDCAHRRRGRWSFAAPQQLIAIYMILCRLRRTLRVLDVSGLTKHGADRLPSIGWWA
jgi:catechol 2,3-dioxygenase-like lactoylglutathione lyase family enzyme